MIKFLGSGSLKPPRSVHLPAKGIVPGHGLLVPSFVEGSVLVKDARGELVRVTWESPADPGKRRKARSGSTRGVVRKTATAESRRRSLAAGVYTIVGYRVIRHDRAGERWFVSATAPRGIRKFSVIAGKQATLEIDQQVTVNCSARRTKMGLRLLVMVSGEIEAGLSIYRARRRIPIEYRVLDAKGRVMARGAMEYG